MSFWKNRPLIITIVLVIILMLLLFLTSGRAADGATSLIGRLISPVQSGMYSASEDLGSFFERLFASGTLAEENARLREDIAGLQAQLREHDQLVQENQRLNDLLNMKEHVPDYEIATARVIGKTPGQWFTQFTISAGARDGVEKDMIVLTADGLMGRVVSVTDTYSRVSSFLDDTSGVPCLIERTRDNGIVRSTGNEDNEDEMLQVSYLRMDADVVPGDTVITSGVGGIFPKGYVVGTVTEVGTEAGTEKTVYLKSAVDFEHVEEVMVVLHVFEEIV